MLSIRAMEAIVCQTSLTATNEWAVIAAPTQPKRHNPQNRSQMCQIYYYSGVNVQRSEVTTPEHLQEGEYSYIHIPPSL